MRFQFDGKGYVIGFKRSKKEYLQYDSEVGLEFSKQSTYPYTTATVVEFDPEKPLEKRVFQTATTGCYHKDKFSVEKGRLRALRLLTRTLPKAMKPVLWKAYHDRVPKPVKGVTIVIPYIDGVQ